MTRGQRVRVCYADVWPQCVCWPNGKVGTVLEVVKHKAIIRLDDFAEQTTVINVCDLEVIPDAT